MAWVKLVSGEAFSGVCSVLASRSRRLRISGFKAILSLLFCFLLPTLASAQEVPLIRSSDGTFEVPVVINDTLRLNFTLDTGASMITLTPDILLTLMRSGTVIEDDLSTEESDFVLADGSTVTGSEVLLKKVTIGNISLHNVRAAVLSSLDSGLLLGQSFLSRLPRWSIDNGRGVLVIDDSARLFWRDNEEFSVEAGSDWSRDPVWENDEPFIFAISNDAGGGYFGVVEVEEDSDAHRLSQNILLTLMDDFVVLDEGWFEVTHAMTNRTIPATVFTVKAKGSTGDGEGYVATLRYGGWSYILMGFWNSAVYPDYPEELFEIMQSFRLYWTAD